MYFISISVWQLNIFQVQWTNHSYLLQFSSVKSLNCDHWITNCMHRVNIFTLYVKLSISWAVQYCLCNEDFLVCRDTYDNLRLYSHSCNWSQVDPGGLIVFPAMPQLIIYYLSSGTLLYNWRYLYNKLFKYVYCNHRLTDFI